MKSGAVIMAMVVYFVLNHAWAKSSDVLGASFPVYTAAASMNTVFSNPPLPMLDNREGAYAFSLMPFTFEGSLERNESDGYGSSGSGLGGSSAALRSGNFDGQGFGLSYSRSVAEKWSVYALGMGANLKGDFRRSGEALGSNQENTTLITDVRATYTMLAAAVVFHAARPEGSPRQWTLFAGPTVTKAEISGQVQENNSVATGGALVSDFAMRADKTMPGVVAGVLLGIDVGTQFRVVPFAILGGSFGDATVEPTVRTNNSSPLLTAINNGGTFAMGTGGGNMGVHLVYKPWGISLNVTAPFIKKNLFMEFDSQGVEVEQVSIAWSWSNNKLAAPAAAEPVVN